MTDINRTLEDPPPADAGLFGVDFNGEQNEVVLIGVPWEPTASYGRGSSQTPRTIIKASHQLDFYDPFLGRELATEIGMLPLEPQWEDNNRKAIELADEIHQGSAEGERRARVLAEVNDISAQLNRELAHRVASLLRAGKTVGILGGDHSSPLGAIKSIHAHHPRMGILHIDAHHDLRCAYEGFTYSHASIMFNVLREVGEELPLVSVGIRDFSKSEYLLAAARTNITTFYDHHLQNQLHAGASWASLCKAILEHCPEELYVSFDIDGLDPKCCPNTGTPVPGGLSFGQAVYLLEEAVRSGHRIVGFDLCEVSPGPGSPVGEWDLNVGARILHKLCALAWASRRPKSS